MSRTRAHLTLRTLALAAHLAPDGALRNQLNVLTGAAAHLTRQPRPRLPRTQPARPALPGLAGMLADARAGLALRTLRLAVRLAPDNAFGARVLLMAHALMQARSGS